MSVSRYRVSGNFDGAREATVEIDRVTGVFRVRPLRRRKAFELTLSAVAELVLWRVVVNEVHEKKKAKRTRLRSVR